MPAPILTSAAGIGLGTAAVAAGGTAVVAAVAVAFIWSASGIGAAPDPSDLDFGAVDPTTVSDPAADEDRLFDLLLSAPIPDGTCGQPGGDMVNGVHTGVAENGRAPGAVWIPGAPFGREGVAGADADASFDASALDARVAIGDLTGDGRGDVAVILECDAGGVAWPANLFVYRQTDDGDLEVLGHENLGTLSDIGRSWFEQVVIVDGALTAEWTGNRSTANAGPPDTAFTLTVGVQNDGIDLSRLDERPIS